MARRPKDEATAGRADAKVARGFLWHVVTFFAVLSMLGFPGWGIFWALGLLSHGGRAMGPLQRVFADGLGTGLSRLGRGDADALPRSTASAPEVERAADDAVVEASALAPPVAAAASDSTETALRAEWARVDGWADKLSQADRARLEEARGAVDRLLERRGDVRAHLADEDPAGLDREAAELETDHAGATDPRTQEVLGQALAALKARREAVTALQAAEQRLDAQARTAMHQLRSLRLSLVGSAAAGPEPARALSQVTAGALEQVRSADELEEALAEARIAPGAAAAQAARQAGRPRTS